MNQSLGLLRSKAGQYGQKSQDWLAVISSYFPHRLTSRLHSKSNPFHCCSEQQATAHAADRSGEAALVSAKKSFAMNFICISHVTSNKQYTITQFICFPMESWGKSIEGSPDPPDFLFWEVAYQTKEWANNHEHPLIIRCAIIGIYIIIMHFFISSLRAVTHCLDLPRLP